MVKIGFASADWSLSALDAEGRPTWGGSGGARCGAIARALDAAGWDTEVGTLVWHEPSTSFLVRRWPVLGQDDLDPELLVRPDVVVLQRWMFASVAVESHRAKAGGQAVIQDLDDNFWALDPRNNAARATDPETSPIENRVFYLEALKAASAVTVSTPALERALRDLGVRVPIVVLRNHVDLDAFWPVRSFNLAKLRAGPKAPSLVGWVGATPWRSGDLEILRGVLGPWVERNDVLTYHGGHLDDAPTFAAQADVRPDRMVTRPMVPIGDYPTLFQDLDIGLVPLNDVVFNRSKSWIKGLEYAAAGVPFVASDLPEYRLLSGEHGIGQVARKPKEWHRHLSALLDPEVRLHAAETNAAQVKRLDIREGIHKWLAVYLDALAMT